MRDETITLSYGGGGYLTQSLINDLILKYFRSSILAKLDDSADLGLESRDISFTTDGYVVKPLFFEGGDIGKIAIAGTVNDLLVNGARPRYISCSFIIEEGLSFELLEKVLKSMARTAKKGGVEIVAGDTKVVEKGSADGIFITTAGVGEKVAQVGKQHIKEGDKIIINGPIAEHGVAVMLAKSGDSGIKSDCAPLTDLILSLLQKFPDDIHFMRDATRGGLGQVLLEVSEMSRHNITINETAIPVSRGARTYCDLLGIDPIYVANEGKVVMFVTGDKADEILAEMKQLTLGRKAHIIGEVNGKTGKARVTLETEIGGHVPLRPISGEQLPRIC